MSCLLLAVVVQETEAVTNNLRKINNQQQSQKEESNNRWLRSSGVDDDDENLHDDFTEEEDEEEEEYEYEYENEEYGDDENVAEDWLYGKDENMQISRTNRMIYVHIPKTGGTSIERSGLFDDAQAHHAIGGHYDIGELEQFSDERRIDDTFYRFATIRHPCSRFISAFVYFQTKAGNKEDNELWEQRIGPVKDIDEFVQRLESSEKTWRAQLWKFKHFDPQHFYVMHNKDIIFLSRFGVDGLVCQEDFPSGLQTVSSATGIEIPERLMTGDLVHKHIDHLSCSDLSDSTREVLERRYALDYCLFDYPTGGSEDMPGYCQSGIADRETFTERYKMCFDEIRRKATS